MSPLLLILIFFLLPVQGMAEISPLTHTLETLQNINGVHFRWTDEVTGEVHQQLGLLPDEVERFFPESVVQDKSGHKQVLYRELMAILVEAIKEVEARREADVIACQQQNRGPSGTFPAGQLIVTKIGVGGNAPASLFDVNETLSGTPSLTGAYVGQSTSTFTDNNTVGSGTTTNMAFNSVAAPTLAATNASVTTTNAYTNYIAGAPIKGANNTATNAIALGIGAQNVGAQANSFGLYVNAQTGASNNYAAAFMGGNVGIGTANPGQKLSVSGTIESTIGGIKFPDGTTETTAAVPISATLWGDQSSVVSGSALLMQHDTGQNYAMYSYQNPANNGDTFQQGFVLKAGTYTMNVLIVTYATQGKVDWYIDNTLVWSGMDTYSSGVIYNVLQTQSVTIVGSGAHTLKGIVNGKNASASAYAIPWTKIWFY